MRKCPCHLQKKGQKEPRATRAGGSEKESGELESGKLLAILDAGVLIRGVLLDEALAV